MTDTVYVCKVTAISELPEDTCDLKSTAHLLVATSKYAGAWIDALPNTVFGVRMANYDIANHCLVSEWQIMI